jgi:hypothetical protein
MGGFLLAVNRQGFLRHTLIAAVRENARLFVVNATAYKLR